MDAVNFNPNTGSFESGNITSLESPINSSPMIQDTKAYQITMGDGNGLQVVPKGIFNADDFRFASSGVLGTATTKYGSVIQYESDMTDDTLVTVNGIQMTAKSAASAGYLVRNRDGSYGETGKKPEGGFENNSQSSLADTESQTEDSDPINNALFDSHVEAALASVAQELGGNDQLDRHALDAMSGLARGDFTLAAKNLAVAAHATHEEAAAFISDAVEGFRKQAAQYVNQKFPGTDAQAVFDWASESLSATEKALMYHRVYLGRAGVLDNLVQKYQRATSHLATKQGAGNN